MNNPGADELTLLHRTCLRTRSRSEIGSILGRIKHLKSKIQERWPYSSNGATIETTMDESEQAMSRTMIHSRLEYYLLHMFIGRPFILAHRPSHSGASSSNANARASHLELARTGQAEPKDQWDFLVQDCVSSAKEVIRICHIMQTGPIGLARASYAEYSSCRASLLVLIAYSIRYRTNEFSTMLRQGLDSIREMASVGDSARSEVSLIETLEAALHRLQIFDASPSRQNNTSNHDPAQEEYQGFMDWYTQLSSTSNPRIKSTSAISNGSVRVSTPPNRVGSQMEQDNDDAATEFPQNSLILDDYPFDFDLLNSENNAAFFTPDFHNQGNPERQLLENFVWVPRQ